MAVSRISGVSAYFLLGDKSWLLISPQGTDEHY